jgi:diadenosine tetraphosphate (Ap4A) HIT family hydrolase
MSFLIPVKRLRETSNLIAFHHPSPSYKVHVLIVPKRQVDSLASLDPQDTAFLTDLYATVKALWKNSTSKPIVSSSTAENIRIFRICIFI